jgi:hypothetical protein
MYACAYYIYIYIYIYIKTSIPFLFDVEVLMNIDESDLSI